LLPRRRMPNRPENRGRSDFERALRSQNCRHLRERRPAVARAWHHDRGPPPPIVPRVSKGIRTVLVIALGTGALYLAVYLLLAGPLGLDPDASGFAGCARWDWQPFPIHVGEEACLQIRRFALLVVAGGAVIVAWTVWSGRR
jgi:hypothetical protein